MSTNTSLDDNINITLPKKIYVDIASNGDYFMYFLNE